VAAGDVSASFSLGWTGSDFDPQLTSPGGRVINESTVAPDVEVTQAATSVTITVDAPEAGTWQLQATGVSVPAPEPVTYDVIETGTAVRSELDATNVGAAGAPIVVRFSLTDDSAGLVGGTGEATVTDPSGQVRHFALYDDGAHGDTSPNDGVYGAYVWATDLAGTYQLEVAVAGTRSDGKPIARQESAGLTLGPKLDTDGDGVADASEALLGTDPADALDGAVDWDGDGVDLAEELILGTDYVSWDTDAGGESDQSELAAGRDPRRAADDRAFPPIWLSTQAIDGSRASVSVATADGSGEVRIYRVDDVSRTDLGLKPGAGSTFLDGPVAPGTYQYVALVVAADGSMSAPVVGPTLLLAADVTTPFVRISANDGVWATSSRDARIVFTDLSEPVTEMRLAESEADLAAAPWVPYANPTIFTIGPVAGRHFVLAQVRDAAGNVSNVASAIVDLVDTTPPVSQAGPLPASTSAPSIDVPFAASDDLSGVASVELWSRYRATDADPWGTWTLGPTATGSPIPFTFASGDGLYEFYTIAADGAGNREAPPAAADAATRRTGSDTTAPTSQAGPLNATYATNSISVPFTATDDASGVASVELWVRYRVNETRSWGAWALAAAATSSPIGYTFSWGDGNYEFYTVAVDAAGNREAPPASADVATRRDAIDDAPDFSLDGLAERSSVSGPITFVGGGGAVDDRSSVAVTWRLYGVKSNGQRQKLFDFKPAVATDGAFDSRIESYRLTDGPRTGTYVSYDVEVRVAAGGQTTTRTQRFWVFWCDDGICTGAPAP